MLVFEENLFGIPECELDLAKLFPDKKERLRFDGKLQSFLASDPTNSEIYFLKRDALRYYTESFISNNNDGRLRPDYAHLRIPVSYFGRLPC